MRRAGLVSIAILLLVTVTGCECADQPVATARPLPTAASTTAAPTVAPTDVPTATPTPFPTDTPVPTHTPVPTDTPEPTLTPTPAATATPEVVLTRLGEYEGVLQVEPGFGEQVKAIEGAAPWATLRDIGSLSGDDAGQRVMIEGSVIRVEGRGTWARVFVGDETGEVLVFIYENVLARIPNNTALGVEGTRVRVVGTVDIYEYNLEILPALPYDVVVLD